MDGGWKSVVGSSSEFESPAFAVERDIEGNDNVGALGDGLLRRYCCCATSSAACAVRGSLLFGELEKNDVSRVALEKDVLRGPCLSVLGADEFEEALVKGIVNRLGISKGCVVCAIAQGFDGSLMFRNSSRYRL
jgi:hypothetical protein